MAEPLSLSRNVFEDRLRVMQEQLSNSAARGEFTSSRAFEDAVRKLSVDIFPEYSVNPDYVPQLFPDIPIGDYGIEVKYTEKDSWRCIGNSIFEGHRVESVKTIYVMYAKMGGEPAVRFRLYDRAICHVRTSHVPRFEVSMDENSPSLFDSMGIAYEDFYHLSEESKMPFVRSYARSRLKEGEHLWWIEDFETPDEHSVPIVARPYINLSESEKRKVRAEAALLCPRILGGSRDKNKYVDVAMFLLTYHGIAAHQARDMFTAGSASHNGTCAGDPSLNGNYLACALYDIQSEILIAAQYLPDELFIEYWGASCPPEKRIERWLEKADRCAAHDGRWIPSEHLFRLD